MCLFCCFEAKLNVTKYDLIESLSQKQPHLMRKDIELAVNCILEKAIQALSAGERIEIRGFGSFSLHFHPPRMGRNPKTGDAVALKSRHVVHFKSGRELKGRVNAERLNYKITS